MRAAAKRKKIPKTNAVRERLEARISAEQKTFFQRAAALKGVTLTDFVIDSLQTAAIRTLEEHDVLKLGLEDRQTFVEALMNPPAPSEASQRAVERYMRMTDH